MACPRFVILALLALNAATVVQSATFLRRSGGMPRGAESKVRVSALQQEAQAGRVFRTAAYSCKAGKEAEFSALMQDVEKEFLATAGLVDVSTEMSGQTFSFYSLFESQADLDAYKSNLKVKFLAKMVPLLGGPALFDFSGPIQSRYVAAGAGPGAGHVLRTVSYKCKPGVEQAWSELLQELADEAQDINGMNALEVAFSDPQTALIAMNFESQALLSAYAASFKVRFLARMAPLLAGGAIYEEIGPARIEHFA